MPDLQLASFGAGVAQTEGGAVRAFAPGTVTFHVVGVPAGTGAPVPVKSVENGPADNLTGAFMTDEFGRVPGWVDGVFFGRQVDVWIPPADPVTLMLGITVGATVAANGGDSLTVDLVSTLANGPNLARLHLAYWNDDPVAMVYGVLGAGPASLSAGFRLNPNGGRWSTPQDTGGVVWQEPIYLISTVDDSVVCRLEI